MSSHNSFHSRETLNVDGQSYTYYHLGALSGLAGSRVASLPFSLRVLLENLLRNEDGGFVKRADIEALARWDVTQPVDKEIAFRTARVLLQDFTGVPCVVDLAAMRDAIATLGGDPAQINPLQPVDLVIDHSVQVDEYGTEAADCSTPSSNTSATASATSSCAGAARRSATSASCPRAPASATR